MPTILVVDDRPRERQYLVTLLQYAGHRVMEADDGGRALALMERDLPELVVTDILMPSMDGFEFVRQMREQAETRNTPVILYTAAYDEGATRDLLSQCTGTTLLTKPSEPEVVLETIDKLLGEAPRQLPRLGEDFSSAHLQLVTTKLHGKMADLERANAELAEKESQLRLVTNAVPVLIASIDAEQQFQFANQPHEPWFGTAPSSIRGKALAEVFGERAYSMLSEYVERALKGETVTFETAIELKNGVPKYIRGAYVPDRDAAGAMRGFVSLIEDVSELKKTELALRDTNAALHKSNEALRQFAYAAAHDLREPCRQTALFAEYVSTRYKDKLDARGEEFLEYCRSGANRMAALVADLLTFAELTSCFESPATKAPIDANEILSRTLEDLKLSVQESGARITCSDLPYVCVAPVHLSQIFLNLIGNAIKFRDPCRPLEIAITARNGEGHFSISDNGMGIAPEYHAKVFSLFQRLNGDQYPGTGIGLALCQRIIEQYGGCIWLESEADKGSTFHFTLPEGNDRR
jgi:PAS domain S-box-containing protein